MSRKLCINFEVRNMLIMKDTLKELGIDYNELNADQIEINRSYHPIAINAATGEISYDEVQEREVCSIKQAYTVNLYKDQAIREGANLKEERQANGDIHLRIV
jgi:hypothetical protein